ncbi:MAG: hypothetical protein V4472_02555 [Pseudomonadota bacterium]
MLSLGPFALVACERKPVQPAKPAAYAESRCGGIPSWSKQGVENGELMSFNRIEVAPSKLLWNGVPIDRDILADYLNQIRLMNPQPVTALTIAQTAKCEDVAAVRQTMEGRLQCASEIHCVEYSMAEWRKNHPPPPY